MAKEKWEMSALDAYINKVYKFDVLFVPILCVCAGITITVLNALGLYDVISIPMLIVFDLSVLIYLLIGIYFTRTGIGDNGIVLPEKLRNAKIVIAVLVVVQPNEKRLEWQSFDMDFLSVVRPDEGRLI